MQLVLSKHKVMQYFVNYWYCSRKIPKGLAHVLENTKFCRNVLQFSQSVAMSSAYRKRKLNKVAILITKVQRIARNIKNSISIAIFCNLLFKSPLQIAKGDSSVDLKRNTKEK